MICGRSAGRESAGGAKAEGAAAGALWFVCVAHQLAGAAVTPAVALAGVGDAGDVAISACHAHDAVLQLLELDHGRRVDAAKLPVDHGLPELPVRAGAPSEADGARHTLAAATAPTLLDRHRLAQRVLDHAALLEHRLQRRVVVEVHLCDVQHR